MGNEIDVTGKIITETGEAGARDILEIGEEPTSWLLDTAASLAVEVAGRRGQRIKDVMAEVASRMVELDKYSELREQLLEKLPASYHAYEVVRNAINFRKHKSDVMPVLDGPNTIEAFSRWLTDDKLDYMYNVMRQDPEMTFTPIMTPNVQTVTGERVEMIIEQLERHMPAGKRILVSLGGGHYDKYALAGCSDGEKLVRFGLVPDKFNMESGTTSYQNGLLEERLQLEANFLHVPSVLEAVVYQATRVFGFDILRSDTQVEDSAIRCFNMPLRRGKNVVTVPTVYIHNGALCLDASSEYRQISARVMIGEI